MAAFGSIPMGAVVQDPMRQQVEGASLADMMQQRQLQQQQMQQNASMYPLQQQAAQQQIQAQQMQNQQTQMDLEQNRRILDATNRYYSGSPQNPGSSSTAAAAGNPAAAGAPPAASLGGMMTQPSAGNPAPGAAPPLPAGGMAQSSMMTPAGSPAPVLPGSSLPGGLSAPSADATAQSGPAMGPAQKSAVSFGQGYDNYLNYLSSVPGIMPAKVIAMRTNLLKMQTEAANYDKITADTAILHNTTVAQSAQSLLNLSPDARLAQLPDELTHLVSIRALSPQQQQKLLNDARGQSQILDNDLKQLAGRATSTAQLVEAAQKQAQQWGDQMQSDIATTQGTNDLTGLRNKYLNLGAPRTVVDTYLPEGKQWSPDVAQQAAVSITPEAQRIKQQQDANALWGNRFANAGTDASYTKLLAVSPSQIKDQYSGLVPPGQFNPSTSPDVLRNAALTPEQRTQADLRRTIEMARIGNLDARTNAIVNKPQYGPTFLAREHEKLDQWQTQEQQQWTLKGQLGDLKDETKTPNGTQFLDPTSKATTLQTMDDAQRQRLNDAYVKADTMAQSLHNQQDDMEQQYHWGKYATAAPATPAPAAPGGASGASSPPSPGGTPARGATRTLTQADVDRLAQNGHSGYHAGQTVTFNGTAWN